MMRVEWNDEILLHRLISLARPVDVDDEDDGAAAAVTEEHNSDIDSAAVVVMEVLVDD